MEGFQQVGAEVSAVGIYARGQRGKRVDRALCILHAVEIFAHDREQICDRLRAVVWNGVVDLTGYVDQLTRAGRKAVERAGERVGEVVIGAGLAAGADQIRADEIAACQEGKAVEIDQRGQVSAAKQLERGGEAVAAGAGLRAFVFGFGLRRLRRGAADRRRITDGRTGCAGGGIVAKTIVTHAITP